MRTLAAFFVAIACVQCGRLSSSMTFDEAPRSPFLCTIDDCPPPPPPPPPPPLPGCDETPTSCGPVRACLDCTRIAVPANSTPSCVLTKCAYTCVPGFANTGTECVGTS